MPLPELVIFDCDGTLVDSELISNQTLAETLTEFGLPTTTEDSYATYKGQFMPEILRIAADRLGHPLPEGFLARYETVRADAFRERLQAVPGADVAVRAVLAAGIPTCVATQGKRDKTELTLGLTGLLELIGAEAIFTAHDVARAKPFPDLFLAAAAHYGAAPERTVVIEDTPLGAAAGVAAGMRVLGYTGDIDSEALREAGAEPFDRLADVPGLIGLATADQ